ncbi:hypothetical protein OO184_03000 [Photorhabdus sp. APURE]|nr:hypothetical protein [Photorhabdus aballayi]
MNNTYFAERNLIFFCYGREDIPDRGVEMTQTGVPFLRIGEVLYQELEAEYPMMIECHGYPR